MNNLVNSTNPSCSYCSTDLDPSIPDLCGLCPDCLRSASKILKNHHRQHSLMSSESAEHYTPGWVLDASIEAMGHIDLDPCAAAVYRIPARLHYTAEMDGLTRPWIGNIFHNPPYGRQILPWVTRCREQYEMGNVTQAISLLPARVDTKWWSVLGGFPWCAVDGRLKFLEQVVVQGVVGFLEDNSGLKYTETLEIREQAHSAPFPSAVIYCGPNVDRFRQVFGKFGQIYA